MREKDYEEWLRKKEDEERRKKEDEEQRIKMEAQRIRDEEQKKKEEEEKKLREEEEKRKKEKPQTLSSKELEEVHKFLNYSLNIELDTKHKMLLRRIEAIEAKLVPSANPPLSK